MEIPQGKLIVLFDGVCNLCNGTVRFVIDRDPRKKFSFASLQSETGKQVLSLYQLPQDYIHSVILLKKGKIYQNSDAVLEICRELPGGWKILYVLKIIPGFIRDFFYRLIAANRYKLFGKSETCMMPLPEIKERFLD